MDVAQRLMARNRAFLPVISGKADKAELSFRIGRVEFTVTAEVIEKEKQTTKAKKK